MGGLGYGETGDQEKESASFIFHFSFLIFHLGFVELLTPCSCDFVDRSHLSAKQTIHELTRSSTKMRSEKMADEK